MVAVEAPGPVTPPMRCWNSLATSGGIPGGLSPLACWVPAPDRQMKIPVMRMTVATAMIAITGFNFCFKLFHLLLLMSLHSDIVAIHINR